MRKFTASNGITVSVEPDDDMFIGPDGRLPPKVGLAGGLVTKALREFFLHERDQELGRWRWPESPDYVVYPIIEPGHERAFGPNLSVMVFHEPTGVLKGYCRDEDQGGEYHEYPNAARAYFAAHPPKPWHDTKPGDVWILTIDDEEQAAVVDDEADFRLADGEWIYTNHEPSVSRVTAGRRIYRKGEEE